MSDFIAVWSPEPAILADATTAARNFLASLGPHLAIETAATPHASILLAANRATPCSLLAENGCAALVIGLIPGSTPSSRKRLAHAQDGSRSFAQDLCRRLNFGVAVLACRDGTVRCTTDYLGLYPVFVYANARLTVLASSLAAFEPVLGPRRLVFDLHAMARGLLMAHPVFGEAVYRNVSRMAARTVLDVLRGLMTEHRCATPAMSSRDRVRSKRFTPFCARPRATSCRPPARS